MTRRGRTFARAKPTRAMRCAALTSLLVQRDELDGLDLESLVRCYGLSHGETIAFIDAERLRRAVRA